MEQELLALHEYRRGISEKGEIVFLVKMKEEWRTHRYESLLLSASASHTN
jgi:hypothetical protein